MRTALGWIWRALVAVLDWRTHLRRLTLRPIIDVVFVTNMRDLIDRLLFLGNWRPAFGHFNGPRYWLGGKVAGRTRALDITADEMRTIKGRRKARELFISATQWAEKRGARVILLAAGTKRLFEGRELEELKAMFPKMIFTIGDNGTVLLLVEETLRALKNAGLGRGCRIGVLGPYGFLGEVMTKKLVSLGYEVVGLGPNPGGLEHVGKEYGIATCQSFVQMGKVDAVVACTHSEDASLTAERVEQIRWSNRKLLVVDVAEPSNLRYKEYQKCKKVVIRQDAGNAYSPRLKYVLGAISYRMFRLTRGVTFGCFAEALSIASALKRGGRTSELVGLIDWLTVDDSKMEIVKKMFEMEGFGIPSPRCFGKPVESFNLALDEKGAETQTVRIPAWKLVMQRMHLL